MHRLHVWPCKGRRRCAAGLRWAARAADHRDSGARRSTWCWLPAASLTRAPPPAPALPDRPPAPPQLQHRLARRGRAHAAADEEVSLGLGPGLGLGLGLSLGLSLGPGEIRRASRLCRCRCRLQISRAGRGLWAAGRSPPGHPQSSAGWRAARRRGAACGTCWPPPPRFPSPLLPPGRLLHSEALQRACPIPFDEGRLWKGEGSEQLRAQLQVGTRAGLLACLHGLAGWGGAALPAAPGPALRAEAGGRAGPRVLLPPPKAVRTRSLAALSVSVSVSAARRQRAQATLYSSPGPPCSFRAANLAALPALRRARPADRLPQRLSPCWLRHLCRPPPFPPSPTPALQTTFHNITRIMDCVGCEKVGGWVGGWAAALWEAGAGGAGAQRRTGPAAGLAAARCCAARRATLACVAAPHRRSHVSTHPHTLTPHAFRLLLAAVQDAGQAADAWDAFVLINQGPPPPPSFPPHQQPPAVQDVGQAAAAPVLCCARFSQRRLPPSLSPLLSLAAVQDVGQAAAAGHRHLTQNPVLRRGLRLRGARARQRWPHRCAPLGSWAGAGAECRPAVWKWRSKRA